MILMIFAYEKIYSLCNMWYKTYGNESLFISLSQLLPWFLRTQVQPPLGIGPWVFQHCTLNPEFPSPNLPPCPLRRYPDVICVSLTLEPMNKFLSPWTSIWDSSTDDCDKEHLPSLALFWVHHANLEECAPLLTHTETSLYLQESPENPTAPFKFTQVLCNEWQPSPPLIGHCRHAFCVLETHLRHCLTTHSHLSLGDLS